jgi:hypothetical protein
LFCVISDGTCDNSGDDGCGGDDGCSGDDGCGGDDSSGDVRMRMRDWQQVGLLQKALLLL